MCVCAHTFFFSFQFQDVTKAIDITTPKAARRGRKRKVMLLLNHRDLKIIFILFKLRKSRDNETLLLNLKLAFTPKSLTFLKDRVFYLGKLFLF